ncbi:hypothetical protein GCM10010348_71230 [Streptomyces anthocyanicus]|nr:hypothetical protein GCM10010348_71230 [Streptomyces anthocyanicus]
MTATPTNSEVRGPYGAKTRADTGENPDDDHQHRTRHPGPVDGGRDHVNADPTEQEREKKIISTVVDFRA